MQVFFPTLWENISMEETFGERLRYLRAEKNLGQVRLAKELNVGKSIISLWELNSCEPTLSNLIAIANFFCVTIDYLAGLEK
jgi:transcriptional regulator with XRE-family HTH domain